MIQRRAKAAGIQTLIGNHTFRATGITAYLKNNGTLETAQHIANHQSPRTTMLYDRRQEGQFHLSRCPGFGVHFWALIGNQCQQWSEPITSIGKDEAPVLFRVFTHD